MVNYNSKLLVWYQAMGRNSIWSHLATMGFASLFMPTLMGIIADRWVNAEKLYLVLHLLYAAVMFYLPQINDPTTFFMPCF